MTIEEIEKKADELYPHAQVIDHNATGHSGFVKGAIWMQEQYENTRLTHSDNRDKYIEKACEWLRENVRPYYKFSIESFRKTMEE